MAARRFNQNLPDIVADLAERDEGPKVADLRRIRPLRAQLLAVPSVFQDIGWALPLLNYCALAIKFLWAHSSLHLPRSRDVNTHRFPHRVVDLLLHLFR